MGQAIKVIGDSGQVSLGKKYAGRQVLIEEVEEGMWVIKTGHFIPDSELWLHEPGVSEKIDRAFASAKKNPPADRLEELEERAGGTGEKH